MEILLKHIAEAVGGEIVTGDEDTLISGIASIDSATDSDISFFFDRRYKKFLKDCGAGALLVSQQDADFAGPQVVVTNPQLAYAKVAAMFAAPLERYPGISDRVQVHETCHLGQNVSVYPGVYLGSEVEIGDESTLFPGVYIGDRVTIGKRTLIYPNVTVFRDCVVGDDVIIHAGTVIGSDGFGFVQDGDESVKIPQNGWVHIEDRVEIGANNCIDRAALGKTWIKRGTKTDNLVHIAHNVVVGEDTIIVAQVGISGSCTIGRNVVIGGQVGLVDHIEVGDRVMIGPQSGITKSISEGQVVTGSPAVPHRQFLKSSAMTARLPQFQSRLKALEKKVAALEKEEKME